MLTANTQGFVLQHSQAQRITQQQTLQSLWSGYGQIIRLHLHQGKYPSAILKRIALPQHSQHPRGWNTDRSHQRKVKSYQVESHWYQHYPKLCTPHSRIPQCYGTQNQDSEQLILLEDLDAAGYPLRLSRPSPSQLQACLHWLAHFHATFMHTPAQGLWPTGTYWHLATRPDELAAMADSPLKEAATLIDHTLSQCPHLTLVHGDAKIANFCFSQEEAQQATQVAALDFQYIGQGCGMKDLAYFLGSALDEDNQARQQEEHLHSYFHALRQALAQHQPQLDPQAIEEAWRPLYPLAAADFLRFLQGWMPSHPKITQHSQKLTQQSLAYLQGQN